MRRSRILLAGWLAVLAAIPKSPAQPYEYPGAYGALFDGIDDAAVYDPKAGVLTRARGLATPSPEFRQVPLAHHGFLNGKFLLAGDVDGDGVRELLFPARSANRVLVLRGSPRGVPEVGEFFVGAGPEALAMAQLDGQPGSEILVATTAGGSLAVRAWNLVRGEPLSPSAVFPDAFASGSLLGFETAASSRGAVDPALGILWRDRSEETGPVFWLLARTPRPDYQPANASRQLRLEDPYTHLISGFPNGANQPGWFLAWGPGLNTVTMLPSTTAGSNEKITIHGQYDLASAQFIPGVKDEVLVIFENGSAQLFDFTPGAGFALKQQFDPPTGSKFVLAAGEHGRLLLLAGNNAGEIAQFNVLEKKGQNYVLVAQGIWPAAPVSSGGFTVVLYTGNPFASPPPIPFETFPAGDWATSASFAAGNVLASVETFAGAAQGLASPTPQVLQPVVNPGAGAVALGNQWEPSSSVFHAGLGAGLVAVTIEPPPGAYANTIGVTFQAGPNVTVHYRVNQNPWQTGSGPVWLTQTATVQYYGEHGGGALGSIQSAVYVINQALAVDSDGDGVPDVIESLAGSHPFKPDTDGDGIDDFSEIIGGSDPGDSRSKARKIDAFTINLKVVWDNPGSAVSPAPAQHLSVVDLFNRDEGIAVRVPGTVPEWSKVQHLRPESRVIKIWTTVGDAAAADRADEPAGLAMTALVGLPRSRPLDIPLDPTARDPLDAWRNAARRATQAVASETVLVRSGPASMVAALIMDSWYGARLLALSRLASFEDRPRLADAPLSSRASIPRREDLAAVQRPQGSQLIAHELSQVVQQINSMVLEGEPFAALRELAESFYRQAVEAHRRGVRLEQPAEALRRVLSGTPAPAGYVLTQSQAGVMAQVNQIIASLAARPVMQVQGKVHFQDALVTELTLPALSPGGALQRTFRLRDRFSSSASLGGGLVAEGSTLSVTAWVSPERPPPGVEAILEVISFSVAARPSDTEPDENQNRLPDAWELAFLGSLDFDFWDDPDGDGFVLGEEYLRGSDPRERGSMPPGAPAVPRNLEVVFDTPGNARIEWEGSATANYELWISADLVTWERYPRAVQRRGERDHAVAIDLERPNAYFRILIDFTRP